MSLEGELQDLEKFLEDALRHLKSGTATHNLCKSILYRVSGMLNNRTDKTSDKDCMTCANNDADICRSCVAKAARAGEYPLWEAKERRLDEIREFQ